MSGDKIYSDKCSSNFCGSFITIILPLATMLNLCLQSCSVDFNRRQVEEWHKLRATGEVALVKHDYATAQKSFEEALKIANEIEKEPVRAAICLEELSNVCLQTKDLSLANTICTEALALANKRSQASKKQLNVLQAELGECLINIGHIFQDGKKFDQAAIAFRQARALFIDVYKHSSSVLPNFIIASYLASSIDGLGTSYRELGQFSQARQAYLSAKDYNLSRSLTTELKEKLLSDFCQIPETSKTDKENYASILGVSI